MFGYSVSSVNLRERPEREKDVGCLIPFSSRVAFPVEMSGASRLGSFFPLTFCCLHSKSIPCLAWEWTVPVWMWNVVFWQEIAAFFFATVCLFCSVERWGHVLHLGGRLRWTLLKPQYIHVLPGLAWWGQVCNNLPFPNASM